MHPLVLLTSCVNPLLEFSSVVGILQLVGGPLQHPDIQLDRGKRLGSPFSDDTHTVHTDSRLLFTTQMGIRERPKPLKLIRRTQQPQGILIAQGPFLSLASALAWQCIRILLLIAKTHRPLKSTLRASRILLSANMFLRYVERTETSIQGLRLTLLVPIWHLLQLGHLSLTPLSTLRNLVLTVVHVSLVFATLVLLERQDDVTKLSLSPLLKRE